MTDKKNGFDGLDDLTGSEQMNAERLRRMKALMRQIHREEFKDKQIHLRPIKGRSLIILTSFVSIILFGVTALYNYNLLVTLEEKVLSTQGHLEYALQRRANLFDNLVNVALNQAALEREVFHQVSAARSAMNQRPATGEGGGKPFSPESGTAPQAAMASPWDRLMALVEQYPDIKVSTSYQKLMDKLVELEDRISQRADEHNEQVRIYNTMITSYPWTVLAQMAGFNRYSYYHTKAVYEDYPKLDGGKFQSLLPTPPVSGAMRQSAHGDGLPFDPVRKSAGDQPGTGKDQRVAP